MKVTLQRHALGVTWVEQGAMARAAHGLVDGGRVWLIDPYEDAEAMAAVAELGTPAGLLQLLDRHNRDCELPAQRFDVPLLRLPVETRGTPFEPVPVISTRAWREVALWWAGQRALVVSEAIGAAPAFPLGRRVGVHPMLRLIPPRKQLSQFEPERLFVGHGERSSPGRRALSATRWHGLVATCRDCWRAFRSCSAAPDLHRTPRRGAQVHAAASVLAAGTPAEDD